MSDLRPPLPPLSRQPAAPMSAWRVGLIMLAQMLAFVLLGRAVGWLIGWPR